MVALETAKVANTATLTFTYEMKVIAVVLML